MFKAGTDGYLHRLFPENREMLPETFCANSAPFRGLRQIGTEASVLPNPARCPGLKDVEIVVRKSEFLKTGSDQSAEGPIIISTRLDNCRFRQNVWLAILP